MFYTKHFARTFLTASVALVTAACTQATPQHTDKMSANYKKVDYQKPGIPLTLSNAKAVMVAPGEAAVLTLTVSSAVDGTVTLDLGSQTDLTLQGSDVRTLVMVAGETRTIELTVASATSGRHYLDVMASLEGLDGLRTVSLPVQVGEGGVVGKSVPGTMGTDADGTPTVLMPAAETIDGVVVRDPMHDAQQPR